MKVLFAVSEVAPIIKLGGLGDVAGALPKALAKLNVDVDVVVPFFPSAKVEQSKLYKNFELNVPFANATYVVEVFNTKLPQSNVDVFLLKNAHFFAKGGTLAFAGELTETEMFSFFDRAVVEFIKARLNTYDLVHCNDWHTGLITHLLKDELGSARPATLFTVHNLLYQGIGGLKVLEEVGIVPGSHELIEWDVSDGDLNLMLQGLTSSDYVSTVSPSYATEILTSEFGGTFEDVLQARSGRIAGILNGIDYTHLVRNYDVTNFTEGKQIQKQKLQENLALPVGNCPLFSFIGRIDSNQKGLDILFDVIPEIVKLGGQFILLGTGDTTWEEKLQELAGGNVSVNIKFDIDLANLMYSGSDFLIVPSKYEPCGLIQMLAMWYGTLPIVHRVGGLRDTVDDSITGFSFEGYSSKDLLAAVKRATAIYARPQALSTMIKNAMSANFSWEKSALEYKKLYEKSIKLRKLAIELSM